MQEEARPTIESKGGELAGRQRYIMYSNLQGILPVISLKQEGILDLPPLETGESGFPTRHPFQEDIRFDPETGAIYMTSWKHMETFIDPETGKRSIKSPEDYTYISRLPDSDIQDPEDLPKKGEVKRLVLSRVWDGVEAAIRQVNHILEEYDPADLNAEPQKNRRAIYWIDEESRRLREGPVTRDQLEQLSQEARDLIDKAGLSSAVNEDKKKLAGQLIAASNTDSLGRVNPMISRIRLRSARLAALRRIVTAELVTRKFSANLSVLIGERVVTRYSLEQAYNELGEIQQRLDSEQISESERQDLANEVGEIAVHYLSFPRVAPYLIPSRLAAIFLVGCREEKKDLNCKVLGEETAEEVFSLPPATSLLEEGNITEASDRIRWARSVLDDALNIEEHKNIYPTSEDTDTA